MKNQHMKQQIYAAVLTLLLFLTYAYTRAQGPYRSLSDTAKLVKVYVKTVHDGDTFRGYFGETSRPAGEDSTSVLFRLASIDAPEQTSPWLYVDQPYGRASGGYLRSRIVRAVVYIDTASIVQKKDMYGRYIVDVYVKQSNSLSYVNQDIVSAGLAWYRSTARQSKLTHNRSISSSFSNAKKRKLNIWSKPETAVAPWTWRSMHTN